MTSSMTNTGNLQGGKQSKDKKKDLAALVDEGFAEITNSMATLTGKVNDTENHLEELESTWDFRELRREVQGAINFVVVNVNQEVQALRASKAA